MRIAAMILAVLTAMPMAMPDNADAGRRYSALRILKRPRGIYVRPRASASRPYSGFAEGAAAGAVGGAGSWTYDQMSSPLQQEGTERQEGCIDCQKPYRDRMELEERCRTGR